MTIARLHDTGVDPLFLDQDDVKDADRKKVSLARCTYTTPTNILKRVRKQHPEWWRPSSCHSVPSLKSRACR